MLAAGQRVGGDADEAEQARHRALDLVAQRLRLGVPRELRGAERADHVQGHSGGRPGRVDRDIGGVLQLLDPLRPDPLRGEPVAPAHRDLLGQLLDRDPLGLRLRGIHPGLKARRRRDRGTSRARLAMSPFGSMIRAGMPARSASSRRTTARPVLPDPVIPTITPCVVRSLEPRTRSSAPGLPVAGVDHLAELERAAICHRFESTTTSAVESRDALEDPHRSRSEAGNREARSRATISGSATRPRRRPTSTR